MNETQTEAYKQAMDKVVPGSALNARVLEALRQEALGSSAQYRRTPQQRKSSLLAFTMVRSPQWASIAAALILTTGLLMGGNILYATPVSWIDVDINPSVELGMNLFQRVVSVEAMNEDGDALVSGLELRGKPANSAVSALVMEAAEMGYFPSKNEAVISLTVIDKRLHRSESLAASARLGTHAALAEAGVSAKVVEQVADQDQILQAESLQKTGHEVSPGKLLLIKKLAALEAEVNNSVSNNAKPSDFDAPFWYGASVRQIQEKIDAHRASLIKQQEHDLELEVQKAIRKAERDALKEKEKVEQEALKDIEKAAQEAQKEADKAKQDAQKEADKAKQEFLMEADKEEQEAQKEADKAKQDAQKDTDKTEQNDDKAKQSDDKETQGSPNNESRSMTDTETQTASKPDVLPNGKPNPSVSESENQGNAQKSEQTTGKPEASANANANANAVTPEQSGTSGKSADAPAADKVDKSDK